MRSAKLTSSASCSDSLPNPDSRLTDLYWPESPPPRTSQRNLAFSYCIWVTIVTIAISGTTGNLFGLGVIMALVGGVTVAIPAGSLAWLMRRWSLPPWVPAVPIVAACLITAYDRVAAQQEVGAMPGNLEEIRRAERAYAGGRTDHTYTCNGPDLPGLTGIKWRTADNSDGSHHSEGEYKGFWIVLSCAPSEHPTYFSVHARGLWKNAPSFEINSDSTKPTIRQE